MVKNTKGGKGAKGLARKNSSNSFTPSEKLRISTEELEQYGCVTKMFGNGMCEVTMNDNRKLVGHIRGSFRGRQKHRNMVTVSCVVLVGLREWERTNLNCDILYIYDDNQVEQLKNIPQINIQNIIQMKLGSSATRAQAENNIDFTNETEDEITDMLETVDKFTIQEEQQIDIEDI